MEPDEPVVLARTGPPASMTRPDLEWLGHSMRISFTHETGMRVKLEFVCERENRHEGECRGRLTSSEWGWE